MKAIVWTKYGSPDVLRLMEIGKPSPREDEVLIKVNAATVTAGDCEMRSLKFPIWLSLPMRLYIGVRKPKRVRIIGQELAGEIEAVGKKVSHYKVGDQVFASTGFSTGTYAEYVCLPEKPEEGALALKPTNMSHEEAAAVPLGGLESLHFLRKGNVRSGQKVLINGAGGSIGTFGIQLAKHFGAEVTAVDSTAKLDMLRAIGADQVIDYTRGDFTKNGQTYDVIFDVVGKSSFGASMRSLNENGVYLIANPRLSTLIRARWASRFSSKKVILEMTIQKTEDLNFLKGLVEAGKIRTVIDRRYPLEKTADAHRYVETGQKKGNVIITIDHNKT
jgi:NADPH:quinone reductase-like Zn-dependent oxidoreductase